MFQSLIALENSQIDIVLDAVRRLCVLRGIEIESPKGGEAMAIAVDLVTARRPSNLLQALELHFPEIVL